MDDIKDKTYIAAIQDKIFELGASIEFGEIAPEEMAKVDFLATMLQIAQKKEKATYKYDPCKPTLQDLCKTKFGTVKAFAAAWGYSTSKASYLLRGTYQYDLSRKEVQELADIFEISFEEIVDAIDNAFAKNQQPEWLNTANWKLRKRWRREEEENWPKSWRAQDKAKQEAYQKVKQKD